MRRVYLLRAVGIGVLDIDMVVYVKQCQALTYVGIGTTTCAAGHSFNLLVPTYLSILINHVAQFFKWVRSGTTGLSLLQETPMGTCWETIWDEFGTVVGNAPLPIIYSPSEFVSVWASLLHLQETHRLGERMLGRECGRNDKGVGGSSGQWQWKEAS